MSIIIIIINDPKVDNNESIANEEGMYDFFMRIEEEMAIEEEQLRGIKRRRRNRRIGVGLATRD